MSTLAVESIGIIATAFILISMCFKTTSIKGSILMRILNIVGSSIFVVYGIILPAISTAVLNGALIIINVYHLVLLLKGNKKN